MREKILVAGSGIAGLGAALALGDGARDVTILDRDPPPPRRLGRRRLLQLGTQRRDAASPQPRLSRPPDDAHPRTLSRPDGRTPRARTRASSASKTACRRISRRATCRCRATRIASFSSADARRSNSSCAVMRRNFPASPSCTDAGVRGLITRRENGKLIVEGLQGRAQRRSARDARRRRRRCVGSQHLLSATGCAREGVLVARGDRARAAFSISRGTTSCATARASRRATACPGRRDLGYIKFGVFIADNRHFSVTLATPEIETEMRMAVVKPENFDAICMALPGARALDESGARRAREPGLLDGQSAKCLAPHAERRRAAGAQLLRHRRCGGAHQSALRPRLLGRRRQRASVARRARFLALAGRARQDVRRARSQSVIRPYFDFHGRTRPQRHPPRRA